MLRKSCKQYILPGIVILIPGFLACLFLFGKLFPFSPVITGFTKHELGHSLVYVQKGAEFTEFEAVDTLIPSVEDFHELNSGINRGSLFSATAWRIFVIRRRKPGSVPFPAADCLCRPGL